MNQQQNKEEENTQMLDTNIKQFIETARRHFFGLIALEAVHTTSPARMLQ